MKFNFLDGNRFVRTSSCCVPIFHLLIPIPTILLHRCCRWPPPRLAHDSTFMLSVHFYDIIGRKWPCSVKELSKSILLATIFCFHSIRRYRISSIIKCGCMSGQCRKGNHANEGHATFRANVDNSIVIHEIQ